MKRKAISLLMAFVMLTCLIPASFAANTQGLENFKKTNTYSDGKFTDVPASDWFAENVKVAYELGLVKGSSETTFNPKGSITIAETIVLASRLHNIYNGGTGEFTQGTPWYGVYVDYALKNKLISNTYSDYNSKISRANFAFILAQALPGDALPAINEIADGTLPDVADDYKADEIHTLYRAGVLTGNDEFGTFNPNSTITRAEVAAIITRMADKAQRKTFSLKKKATVPAEIYRGAVKYADMIFANTSGIKLSDALDETFNYGVTGADILKQQALSMVTEFEAARMFAIENGINLSEEDKKEIAAGKEAQYKALGGRDAFVASLAANGMNEAFYDYVTECQTYYAKAFELFAEGEKYAVDTAGIAEILSESYIRVKHILIQTEPDDAENKALANELLQKISRGEDFEKLLAEYGEDPGMEVSSDGYLIDSNGYTPDGSQMIQEFTEAAVALEVGETSDVVTTAYGFHIIKRYPVDKTFTDSYIAENKELFEGNALVNMLSEYMGDVVIANRAELEKIDVKSVFGK